MGTEARTQVMEVTERAAQKARSLATREGDQPAGLRVRVTAGGCSGFSYKLSFDAAPPGADDNVIEAHGLRVLIDAKSAPILQGSTLDFQDAMLGGGFKLHNPNAVHECACGESFSL